VTPKQFQRFRDRDVRCWHCGSDGDDLIPHHRANRGHGGFKAGDRPSNCLVFCSISNGLLESDPVLAETARRFGWKLSRYDDPCKVPVWDVWSGSWFLLDDVFGRVPVE
jgi:hypothetical protein